MSDSLTRICSTSDLTSIERAILYSQLESIGGTLSQIDRGAGFCEDRGFGWTADMEKAEGSDVLFEKLRAWPILRRLLPSLRHLRHQSNPVIGFSYIPHDEVLAAKLMVSGQRTFSGKFAEGWGESTITVALESNSIRVSERTVAGGIGDQPFSSSEELFDYLETGLDKLRESVRKKLEPVVFREMLALAARLKNTMFPCDHCGIPSQTLRIRGSTLVCDSPFSGQTHDDLDDPTLDLLFGALAEQNLPAIRVFRKEWTEGYCEVCDASFCRQHLLAQNDGPLNQHARCPHGHSWEI